MKKALVLGLASYLPPLYKVLAKGTGGTDSSRYCYSIWLRHMVMAREHSLDIRPRSVAELGPGDSIGIGLAALISGVESYFAFDVVEFANLGRNLKIFDELVDLFRRRERIPGEDEFPNIKPKVASHDFPSSIFPSEILDKALDPARLKAIRASVESSGGPDSCIRYMVPWYDSRVLKGGSVDMLYSQAVLEHVDDLPNAYRAMFSWLKPGGFMSHQIDFKCHGTSPSWNGHWAYSEFMWGLIRGKRPFLLNREPFSTHQRRLDERGFQTLGVLRVKQPTDVPPAKLAPRFKGMSDDDLTTSAAFVVARKPGG